MASLKENVLASGFALMTEDELYAVNGGRLRDNGFERGHHFDSDCGNRAESCSKAEEKKCRRCETAREVIRATETHMFSPNDNSTASRLSVGFAAATNLIAHAVKDNCEKSGHRQ